LFFKFWQLVDIDATFLFLLVIIPNIRIKNIFDFTSIFSNLPKRTDKKISFIKINTIYFRNNKSL